ncbi:MAG: hypothetical protein JW739_05760 [Opitutales bacterium]|nr:hypothetical protein [Opitutales bacterium]
MDKKSFCEKYLKFHQTIIKKTEALGHLRVELEELKKSHNYFAARHLNELTELRAGDKILFRGKVRTVEEVLCADVMHIDGEEPFLYLFIRLNDYEQVVSLAPEPDNNWQFVKEGKING